MIFRFQSIYSVLKLSFDILNIYSNNQTKLSIHFPWHTNHTYIKVHNQNFNIWATSEQFLYQFFSPYSSLLEGLIIFHCVSGIVLWNMIEALDDVIFLQRTFTNPDSNF